MCIAETLYAAQSKAAAIPAGDEFHRALILGMHRATEAVEEFDDLDKLRADPRIVRAFSLLWRVVLGAKDADPLPALLAEWIGTHADHSAAEQAAELVEIKRTPGDAEQLRKRADVLQREVNRLEDLIIATAPTSLVGLLAKIRFQNLYHADNLANDHVESDESVPENGIRLALERDIGALLSITLPAETAQPLPVAAE